jgi:hypothetical protein
VFKGHLIRAFLLYFGMSDIEAEPTKNCAAYASARKGLQAAEAQLKGARDSRSKTGISAALAARTEAAAVLKQEKESLCEDFAQHVIQTMTLLPSLAYRDDFKKFSFTFDTSRDNQVTCLVKGPRSSRKVCSTASLADVNEDGQRLVNFRQRENKETGNWFETFVVSSLTKIGMGSLKSDGKAEELKRLSHGMFHAGSLLHKEKKREYAERVRQHKENSYNDSMGQGPEAPCTRNAHGQWIITGALLSEALTLATKSGDGVRCNDLRRLSIPINKGRHGAWKYAFWGAQEQMRFRTTMSRLNAFRAIWEQFDNETGGRASNIDVDLGMEHNVREYAFLTAALKSNRKLENIQHLRAVYSSWLAIVKNLDAKAEKFKSNKHEASAKKTKKEILAVVDILAKNGVWEEKGWSDLMLGGIKRPTNPWPEKVRFMQWLARTQCHLGVTKKLECASDPKGPECGNCD